MRKINKNDVRMIKDGKYLAVSERIKNDTNGNPRYQVTVFVNEQYYGAFNTTTYDIEQKVHEIFEQFSKVD